MHAGQVDGGPALEIPAPGLLGERELVARIAFGIGQPTPPPCARVEDVESIEARLVIVAVRNVEHERGETARLVDIGVAVQRHLRQRGERAGLAPAIALLGGLRPDTLHLLRDGRHVPEPPGGPRRLVATLQGRFELEGAKQLLPGGPMRLTRKRSPAGRLERFRRLVGQLEGWTAVELGDQRRGLVQMVGADLEQLLAGALAQPVGEALVQVGSRGLRETRIRHFADQHVLEAVGGFA